MAGNQDPCGSSPHEGLCQTSQFVPWNVADCLLVEERVMRCPGSITVFGSAVVIDNTVHNFGIPEENQDLVCLIRLRYLSHWE